MAISKIKSDSIDTVVATKLTGTVDNARISLDAAEIPNLDAAKITTGSIADARIPASAVTQHSDTSSIENDIAILALQNAINGNMTAHGLNNYWIEQFEDSNSITALTDVARDTSSEYISTIAYGSATEMADGTVSDTIHSIDNSSNPTSGWTNGQSSPSGLLDCLP